MWKRDEAVRPPQPAPPAPSPAASTPPQAAAPRVDTNRPAERDTVNIGKSVIIKGDLSGSEDLTIEGQVEGKIELRQNVLTIGPNGKIKAAVFAKAVVIQGEVQGDITATRAHRHPRRRLGGRRLVGAAHCHRRWRALPRQHRHAEEPGQQAEARSATSRRRRSSRRRFRWRLRRQRGRLASPFLSRRAAARI